MKREIPSAALAVMPNCGHTINLEDPDQFKTASSAISSSSRSRPLAKRDPRAISGSITG